MGKISIVWKLVLAFLLVAITAAAIVSISIRMTSVNRLTELIIDQQRSTLQTSLEAFYQANGSWNGVEGQWIRMMFRSPYDEGYTSPPGNQEADMTPLPQQEGPRPLPVRPGERDRRSLFGLADSEGQVIIATDPGYPVGSTLPAKELRAGTPVTVEGKRVGTILTARLNPRFNPEENLYLQRTNTALLFATMGAMLVALVIGVILASALIRPLQELTQAAKNIARGQLEQQVSVNGSDEIGQLGTAFNRMSQEVARVNQQRKQMTADIAHDLRTPLTVIAGYVESMQDGVLKPTPERLALIYTEIERLQNLVDDLKMLSQVDAGELPLHPRPIPPETLLEHAAAPFQHRAEQQNIMLTVAAEPDVPEINVDEGRLMQVFGNLIANSLRYTAPGGEISLSAARRDGAVVLAVQDTGTGITPEELPFIFDRFHRADKSRHSETGESGLGLAIVKALVEAHHGTVRALSAQGKGTRIEIELPPFAA